MAPRDQLITQLLRTCVFFDGVQHTPCRAGVNLEDVKDRSQPGPFRFPCLDLPGRCATTTCTKKQLYTQAEAEVEADKWERLEQATFGGSADALRQLRAEFDKQLERAPPHESARKRTEDE